MQPAGERGQTAAEYAGLIAVVAVIVLALAAGGASGIGGQIADGITSAICRVASGSDCAADHAAADAGPSAPFVEAGHPAAPLVEGLMTAGEEGAAETEAFLAGLSASDRDTLTAAAPELFFQLPGVSPEQQLDAAAALAAKRGDPGTGPEPDQRLLQPALAVVAERGTPEQVAEFFAPLSVSDRERLASTQPGLIGSLEGAPTAVRSAANRRLILDHVADLEAERAAYIARHPWLVKELRGPGDDLRRAWDDLLSLQDVDVDPSGPTGVIDALIGFPDERESKQAVLADFDERIARYRRWADEERRILAFDPSGRGRVAEVLGDVPLEQADHVAVVVPGVWNDIDNYDAVFRRQVSEVQNAIGAVPGNHEAATVAWLGYETPKAVASWRAVTPGAAEAGGERLVNFVEGLDAIGVEAEDRLVVAHSYGTVVTADALRGGMAVDDVALLAGPGTRGGSVTDLQTDATVWAATAPWDPIRLAPNEGLGPLTHGRDPTDKDFDARVFATGVAADHAGYFNDADTLETIARITLDQDELVRP